MRFSLWFFFGWLKFSRWAFRPYPAVIEEVRSESIPNKVTHLFLMRLLLIPIFATSISFMLIVMFIFKFDLYIAVVCGYE